MSSTKLVFIVVSAFQPTIRLEKASIANATSATPDHIATYVKSETHSRFGAAALKSRSTRSRGRSAWVSSGIVVPAFLPRIAPCGPSASVVPPCSVRRRRLAAQLPPTLRTP